ncbi:MAG: DUF1015 domain-containing protein [Desulfobacterales bacterium]
MAEVQPFRGIRYNPEIVPDLGEVTTPPYDVISEAEQDTFHARHPHNIIRLILGKKEKGDSGASNPHTRAAESFSRWLREGALIRDREPGYYLTSVEFEHQGRILSRFGLIARVALEPFDRGIILPHEATFSAIKTERLGLMRQCHANFSPIFSLFPDPDGLMETLRAEAEGRLPVTGFMDGSGHRHRMWHLTDEAPCRRIRDALAHQKLFIADGHHRYETALAYRDEVSRSEPGFSSEHPANFIMMYLSSMKDPGLIVLPAHRLIRGVDRSRLMTFADHASTSFEIEDVAVDRGSADDIQAALRPDEPGGCRIGLLMSGVKKLTVLTARPETVRQRLAATMPEVLASLDVSVLTHLIFPDLLGIAPEELDSVGRIRYTSRTAEAVAEVFDGRADAAFLLNPTRIDQVRRIAEEGLVMPRKTTYFAPKVITGLVLNTLCP